MFSSIFNNSISYEFKLFKQFLNYSNLKVILTDFIVKAILYTTSVIVVKNWQITVKLRLYYNFKLPLHLN